MRYLDINEIREGMMLVRPIYSNRGIKLLGANTCLTKHHINRIKALGYERLYVFENESIVEKYEEVLSESLRVKAIKGLKTLNLDAVTFLANQMVGELVSKSDILIDLADIRGYHDYTYNHCVNVALLSVTMGIGLGLDNEKLGMLAIGAILHDIGKVVIDKNIIDKKDRLTNEEFEIIKKHPQYGYNMLKDNFEISSLSRIAVLMHHENEDGTGYPFGKKGDEIHLFAKIIHVADVFDALITERSYKKAFSPSEAFEFLMSNCGKMFNREVVEAFMKYVAIYPIGARVELSNGKIATIEKNHSTTILRPIIKLDSGEIIDLRDDFKFLNVTIIKLLD